MLEPQYTPVDLQWKSVLLPGAMSSGGCTGEDIEMAEKSLGVIFPDEIRQFLVEFGAVCYRGGLSGSDVAGILSPCEDTSTPMWLDIVEITRRNRAVSPETYGPYSLAVGSDGWGTNYWYDDCRGAGVAEVLCGLGGRSYTPIRFRCLEELLRWTLSDECEP